MTTPTLQQQLDTLLDPTLRVGDHVHLLDHLDTWGTISHITDQTATLHYLTEIGPPGPDHAPLDRLAHSDGTPHLTRRPPHPRCLAPGCPTRHTSPDHPHDGWLIVRGWPDRDAKRYRQDWRWVQACADHHDLALAYIRDWIGPHGLIDYPGRAEPASTPPPSSTPEPVEQLTFF